MVFLFLFFLSPGTLATRATIAGRFPGRTLVFLLEHCSGHVGTSLCYPLMAWRPHCKNGDKRPLIDWTHTNLVFSVNSFDRSHSYICSMILFSLRLFTFYSTHTMTVGYRLYMFMFSFPSHQNTPSICFCYCHCGPPVKKSVHVDAFQGRVSPAVAFPLNGFKHQRCNSCKISPCKIYQNCID